MLHPIEINPKVSPRASVILLHGLGASGHDFVDIVPQLKLPAALAVRFVFPHAPVRPVKYAGNAKMRAWFDLDAIDRGVEDEDGIRQSTKIIEQLIVKERELGVPSEKIVLAGFSQGGAMALQCGLRYEETLAGILVLSSWLPLLNKVMQERSALNTRTPILFMHGTNDDLVPLHFAQESCDYLKKIGCNTKMYSYPMQHSVCAEEIIDISKWLQSVFV